MYKYTSTKTYNQIGPYKIIMGPQSIAASRPFNFDNPEIEPQVVEAALVDYIKNIPMAYSLSASQLGFDFSAFVLMDHNQSHVVYFNPTIVYRSEGSIAVADEMDPSFPSTSIKIKRPYEIRVRYRDVTGNIHSKTLVGAVARFFQHEFDRTQGIKYWTRANPIHRTKFLKDWKKVEKNLERYIVDNTTKV